MNYMIYQKILRIQKPWPISLFFGRPHRKIKTDDRSVATNNMLPCSKTSW